MEDRKDVIPLLCSFFLANQGAGEATGEGKYMSWVSKLVSIYYVLFPSLDSSFPC